MSASSSPQPNDQPTSSHKSADQKQLVVAPGTSVEAANRSVVLCEMEVQLEKLELDTQRDQCADEGEEVKKFFKLAELGGVAGMRAMLKGPNADVLLSAKVNGATALSIAVQEGNAKVVELLKEKGAMDEKGPAVTFVLATCGHGGYQCQLCPNNGHCCRCCSYAPSGHTCAEERERQQRLAGCSLSPSGHSCAEEQGRVDG